MANDIPESVNSPKTTLQLANPGAENPVPEECSSKIGHYRPCERPCSGMEAPPEPEQPKEAPVKRPCPPPVLPPCPPPKEEQKDKEEKA